MDKIDKFLNRLDRRKKQMVADLLAKVILFQIPQSKISKIKGSKRLLKIRQGKIRIIFSENTGIRTIYDIDYQR